MKKRHAAGEDSWDMALVYSIGKFLSYRINNTIMRTRAR